MYITAILSHSTCLSHRENKHPEKSISKSSLRTRHLSPLPSLHLRNVTHPFQFQTSRFPNLPDPVRKPQPREWHPPAGDLATKLLAIIFFLLCGRYLFYLPPATFPSPCSLSSARRSNPRSDTHPGRHLLIISGVCCIMDYANAVIGGCAFRSDERETHS
ncbi:hypothetical protein NPIL_328621 [Nephila pilipes]|uniref:Uncharacterized protein n=1 Tax=Nephila pilipes TaxID=299642 RepID=A0A8X6PJ40_NEPPI|nr:hypothetical protein NPIL_328621 [Nephila pilipes]